MVDLRLGDCLELMKDIPDGSVDLVLTDPPYLCDYSRHDSKSRFSKKIANDENNSANELMKDIHDGSVDLVLTDPPYGTTACKWDSVIPFEPMWEQLNRIIKPNGAICLFGSEPFSSALRMSNIKQFKYDWIWDKVNRYTGYGSCKYCPLKRYEIISVFYKSKPTYNPQMMVGKPYKKTGDYSSKVYGTGKMKKHGVNNGDRYPFNILQYKGDDKKNGFLHPTQKPIDLLEYLIRTYTNEGETVLDFTAGSGSTGVACVNTNRHFIGIELDEGYFNIAKKRIEEAQEQSRIGT